MKQKLFLLLPLLVPLLAGCGKGQKTSEYDPFAIGDNLEKVSTTEATLIANEAYDNLSRTSSLRKTKVDIDDDTGFYTGAFSQYSTKKKTTTDFEVVYYTNKADINETRITTTYVGNDTTIEEYSVSSTDWYGIRPVRKGEEPSENYSLMTKEIQKYNGVSSTRFSHIDDWSSEENLSPNWKHYIVDRIGNNYVKAGIAYSSSYTYVRDKQHLLGYFMSSNIVTENSKVAPGDEEMKYVKKVDILSVVDFYKDDLLEIDWTVRTVSTKTTTSYLSTIDGTESEPIEVSRSEEVASLSYDTDHEPSSDIPTYELTTSIDFSISKFEFQEIEQEEPSEEPVIDLVCVDTKKLSDNNSYYQHFNDKFNGHAYYSELKLEPGLYSFFEGEPEEEEPFSYEEWGYSVIRNNKCSNYIVSLDIVEFPEEEQAVIENHPNLFFVNTKAIYSFRVVFNADMSEASEFTVAMVDKWEE